MTIGPLGLASFRTGRIGDVSPSLPATRASRSAAPAVGSRRSRSATRAPLEGEAEVAVEVLRDSVYRCTVRVFNRTPLADAALRSRDEALMQSLVATHAVLAVQGGKFYSLTDPLESLREVTTACRNIGAWPVLVGRPGEDDTMLASPIILYDYPRIAPESPGDLFDGTEIDEILTLRIMTLTEEEKAMAAATDDRTRNMLMRTESLAREQLAGLHGVSARPFADRSHGPRYRSPGSPCRGPPTIPFPNLLRSRVLWSMKRGCGRETACGCGRGGGRHLRPGPQQQDRHDRVDRAGF